MPRKTDFTPMRKAVKQGKISASDLNDLRESLFFEVMRCLERTRDKCKALGIEPEEAGLSFDNPNATSRKHYATVTLRIG